MVAARECEDGEERREEGCSIAHGASYPGSTALGSSKSPSIAHCILADRASGRRIAQAHVFAAGSEQITRHLASRDHLRAHPEEARAYEAEKLCAQALHPDDVLAYNDAKADWIRACDLRAAAFRTM